MDYNISKIMNLTFKELKNLRDSILRVNTYLTQLNKDVITIQTEINSMNSANFGGKKIKLYALIDDAKKRIHLLKKGLEGTHEEKDLDVALVRYNTFEKHIDTCKTVEDFSRFKTAILEYIDAESIDIRKQHLNLKEALKASMKTMTELQVVGSKL